MKLWREKMKENLNEHNEGKSTADERFLRTLKNNIKKCIYE